jgi:hypothetical protein
MLWLLCWNLLVEEFDLGECGELPAQIGALESFGTSHCCKHGELVATCC